MPLSPIDIYQKLLPKTNCGECGYRTCLAFASMVVSEKLPLKNCPYIPAEKIEDARKELEKQYAEGKWTRRDMAQDALKWAKERAASMQISDLQKRIGGEIVNIKGNQVLELPYFDNFIHISPGQIVKKDGSSLTRWEQVFLFNHMAQGGSGLPSGNWKGLVDFPNTVSKIKSMKKHVEDPLVQRFSGKIDELREKAVNFGGRLIFEADINADVAILFNPLPRIPVMLLFWDENPEDGYGAEVKLLFDETIIDHLDIESIMFLSERIKQLICGEMD
ncbi:MAG: DUF3786 domain-containing protein [Desulfobacterales bacterium]